jgi:hypothetical protein
VIGLVRRHPLWAIVAGGIALRLVLAFAFYGQASDIFGFQLVGHYFVHHPLHPYDVNDHTLGGTTFPPWAYPPAYLLWLAAATGLGDVTGLPWHGIVQLMPIAADVGLALAIYVYLGWRGASERVRLAGAALVMLGPSFIAISGYHGQIDAVAILPGVLALIAWERRPRSERAMGAGLLVGLGAAIKTVPGLLVLALLPAADSLRERVALIGAAAAVPAIMLLPFLIADPGALDWIRANDGFPGKGGMSLAAHPSLGWNWVAHGVTFHSPNSGVSELLADNAARIELATVAVVASILARYRPAPIDGAVLIWLATYAFAPNFFMQYLIWGLPFFIMAGYLREVAILQAVVAPATAIYYAQTSSGDGLGAGFAALYVVTMIGLWAFWVAAFATVALRMARQPTAHRAGIQQPLVRLAPSSSG